eukprot:TRINITY_DN8649_c0_g1_i1.p2 TRINITY_DN8649_c0_g1~~TRINITY_DN8649_c0_g1_i1.p2  ORF type:complete len:204 (+),score=53.33 TRINITY_DN8649_c0_g1_i1:30-614(+)
MPAKDASKVAKAPKVNKVAKADKTAKAARPARPAKAQTEKKEKKAPVKFVQSERAKRRAYKIARDVRQGRTRHQSRRVHHTVQFHSKSTLQTPKKPLYPRRSVPLANKMHEFRVLKHPLTTESAMKKIEDHNTLVFIVDVKSTKRQIKQAVKKLYDITALKVNTLIRPDGKKKAYVRLHPDNDALDVANKIGVI